MKPKALWLQVLKSKYGRGKNLLMEFKSNCSDSSIWRDLARIWPTFKGQISIKVGNGRSTSFWSDASMEGVEFLLNKAIRPLKENELNYKVCYLVTPSRV